MAKFSFIGSLQPTDTTNKIKVDECFNFEMHSGSGELQTDEFKDGYVFWIGASSDDSSIIGSVRFSLEEAVYLRELLNAGIKAAINRMV